MINGLNFGPFDNPNPIFVSMGSNSMTGCVHVNDSMIRCTTPPGDASQQVMAITGWPALNPPIQFQYDPPIVRSISPLSGPTTGATLTIRGLNFGGFCDLTCANSQTLKVDFVSPISGANPFVCAAQTQPKSNHTALVCTTPAGSGTGYTVQITRNSLAGVINETLLWSFAAPVVTKIGPKANGTTDGATPLTIDGLNFGTSAAQISVLIGGVAATAVALPVPHTRITCFTPPGQGANLFVDVVVTSQISPLHTVFFSYLAPSNLAFSPASGAIGDTFTLTGTNLGLTPQVLFDGVVLSECAAAGSPSVTSIVCVVPEGEGLRHVISVNVGGQTAVAAQTFDFRAPQITVVSPPTNAPTSGLSEVALGGTSLGGFVTTPFARTRTYSVYLRSCITLSAATGTPAQGVFRSGANTWNVTTPYLDDGNRRKGACNVTFAPPATTAGLFNNSVYDLMVSFPDIVVGAAARATSVPVLIQSSYGTITRFYDPSVALSTSGGTYVSLGDPVLLGVNPSISIRTSGTSGAVVIDSFRMCRTMATATVPDIISYNSTLLRIPLGAGVGTGGEFVIKVNRTGGGAGSATPARAYQQSSTFTTGLFSFASPSIAAATGCLKQNGPVAVDCEPLNVLGKTKLMITGTNFGNDPNLITVTIKSPLNLVYTCSNVAVVIPHVAINCTLPSIAEAGQLLPITVTVAGQSDVQNFVSYKLPTISSPGLNLGCVIGATLQTEINATTTNGGQLICLNGTNFGSNATNVQVFYGTPKSPLQFVCSVVPSKFTPFAGIGCTLSEGVGINLLFTVKVGVASSLQSVDTLNYPIPVLLNNTIRESLMSSLGRSNYLPLGKSTQGDPLFFDVRHLPFSAAVFSAHVKIRFGLYGGDQSEYADCSTPKVYSSSTLPGVTAAALTYPRAAADANLHAITCHTAPGAGSDLVFTLQANNVFAITSNDTYSYPQGAPKVTRVVGCTEDGGVFDDDDDRNVFSAALGCPTQGGVRITLIGTNLCPIRIVR